jgi:hypothetical protein
MAHLGFVSRVTVSLDGKIIESGIEELQSEFCVSLQTIASAKLARFGTYLP